MDTALDQQQLHDSETYSGMQNLGHSPDPLNENPCFNTMPELHILEKHCCFVTEIYPSCYM